MSSDRIKLSTGATTIVRVPVGRGRSGAATAAFWASIPEATSRDQQDRDGGNEQLPGMPPIPGGAGQLFWRDAVVASSLSGEVAPAPSSSSSHALRAGPTRKGILTSTPSSKAVASTSGTAAAAAGVSFRRSGVASAPIMSAASTTAGEADDAADAERRRLPAIGGGPRAVTSSTPGIVPSGTTPAILPSALKGAASRRAVVSLPSIHGGVSTTIDICPHDSDEEPPIVVSFVPSRPSSANKSVRRGLSWAMVGIGARGGAAAAAGGAAGGGGGGGGGGGKAGADGAGRGQYEVSSADRLAANTAADGATPGGGGIGSGSSGRADNVLLRGIRRLFKKQSRADGGGGAGGEGEGGGGGGGEGGGGGGGEGVSGGDGEGGGGATVSVSTAANASDDTVRQDDTTSSTPALQRSNPSVAKLAREYVREQERMQRVRSSLLAADVRASQGQGPVQGQGQGRQAALPAVKVVSPKGGDVGRDSILSPPAASKVPEASGRSLRSGKSFTQRALEDPHNPAFKTVRQLAALQEKMSYMEDPDWREKAAEMVTMERPILMADGWKV